MKLPLKFVVAFLILISLAAVEAATRPFVLSGVLDYIGVAVLPATNSSACVVPGLTYRVGKGMTITVTDPSLRAHLNSFKGQTVRITVEED